MTTPVDYDHVAPNFNRRYSEHDYRGVTQALLSFVAAATREASPLVLDAGCGTGHWLRLLLDDTPCRTIGLDRSAGMLAIAASAAAPAPLVQASADNLPLVSATFDAVICINAVHHFGDPRRFIAEARRVLRPGGGLFMAGLDPHAGVDTWWLYDTFPEALSADRNRYPSGAQMRQWMAAAGFDDVRSDVVQRWVGTLTGKELFARNMLERTGTSQLMVIPDAAYEAGVAALEADPAASRVTNLHLFSTVGRAR